MTIATLNIDWAKKQRSKTHIHKIEHLLNILDFDILVVTEAVDLNLATYPFVYKSKSLPEGQEYENINYSIYLKGTPANRVTIYSKFQSSKTYRVTDDFTSVCREFETNVGVITIYGTIIGTLFRKPPFAEKELNNCIMDCLRIFQQTKSLCLVGDLNTSFVKTEKNLQINEVTTKLLRDLIKTCNLDLTTGNIKNNIDHIFLHKGLKVKMDVTQDVFVEKNKVSDHQGIVVEIKNKYIS